MCRQTLMPVFLLLTAGCGSQSSTGPSYGGEEGRKIAILVDALIDDRSNYRRMTAHFTSGSAPDNQQWRKFAPYSFEVVGDPVVSGATATAKVRIVFDSNREEKGEVEWAFAKDGENWKITAAPLP